MQLVRCLDVICTDWLKPALPFSSRLQRSETAVLQNRTIARVSSLSVTGRIAQLYYVLYGGPRSKITHNHPHLTYLHTPYICMYLCIHQ